MKNTAFMMDIKAIIPQQQYLSLSKLKAVENNINTQDYGVIYVIEYRHRLFSIDGHHRLYHLYKQGVRTIRVVCDPKDQDNRLYKQLADEAITLGFEHIGSLENRIIESESAYQKAWIDKCQALLKQLKD